MQRPSHSKAFGETACLTLQNSWVGQDGLNPAQSAGIVSKDQTIEAF
jgi:hypothetical protein